LNWFDKKSNCIVTFNDYWNQDWIKDLDEVKKFRNENKIPNVYAIPFNIVWFLYGYPILSPEFSKEIDVIQAYVPTMTDDMLTDKIISKKFGLGIEIDTNGLPTKTARELTYSVSKNSKLILKNGKKYKFTRKESTFFLDRKMIPDEDIHLFP